MIYADQISVERGGGRATGALVVHPDADYLRDHFPGTPILPGLLMLEAAVRVAGALLGGDVDAPPVAMLEHVDRLQIVRSVRPGDTLLIAVERMEAEREPWSFTARGSVDHALALRARFRLRPMTAGATRWHS